MVTLDEGSYEEYPPTPIDFAIRDRRWCQGNLQHLKLLASRRMHWVSRLHLLMGAFAYLSSPLWALLIGVSLVPAGLPGGGERSAALYRQSVVSGKSVSVRLVLGGRRTNKQEKEQECTRLIYAKGRDNKVNDSLR